MAHENSPYERAIQALDKRKLRNLVLRQTTDLAASEDLLQEMYCRLLSRVRRPNPPSPDQVEAVAVGIIKNLLREWRRERRQSSPIDLEECLEDLMKDAGPDPDRLYDGEKQLARLLKAIELLPGRRAQVLTLWVLFDFKASEIARHLRLAQSTVRNHIMQADLSIVAALERDVERQLFTLLLGMIRSRRRPMAKTRKAETKATSWLERLETAKTDEASWSAFRAWIHESPDHDAAYLRRTLTWLARSQTLSCQAMCGL